MKHLDTGSGIRRHDYDIRVEEFTYNCSTGFNAREGRDFNSMPWAQRDLSVFNGDLTGTIFDEYPPDDFQDEYPYGPEYFNTGFDRDIDNCNQGPNLGLYIEDWSEGSEDIAWDFVDTGEELVIAALLNRLEMWSFNDNLGNDTEEGLDCDYSPCHNFDTGAYLWGESYLLFVDKDDLSLTNASHLGTMSGGDFRPKLL